MPADKGILLPVLDQSEEVKKLVIITQNWLQQNRKLKKIKGFCENPDKKIA